MIPNLYRGAAAHVRTGLLAAILVGALGGCSMGEERQTQTIGSAAKTPGIQQKGADAPIGERRGYVRGEAGSIRTGQVRVNGYLWRAALDTVAFMPLLTVDSSGGVIISDWYVPPESPQERFKVNVLIQGLELSSTGVRVTVFRQTKDKKGKWTDAKADNATKLDLESIILSQARVLRSAAKNPGN